MRPIKSALSHQNVHLDAAIHETPVYFPQGLIHMRLMRGGHIQPGMYRTPSPSWGWTTWQGAVFRTCLLTEEPDIQSP